MSDDRLDDEPAHSSYGPSRAEGYSTCLDYVNANEGLPDDTSWEAAEGTAAHAISDTCLQFGFDAVDFIGHTTKVEQWSFTWTLDDALLLQPGIDRVRRRGGEFFSEHRVDISPWTIDGQFGTLDRANVDLVDGTWWICVDDLKWGRGVPVHPERNKQLMLYALGFWRKVVDLLEGDYPIRFRLSIDQPRHPGGGGVWETDLQTLLDFGEWIKERVRLSRLPNPPRTASLDGCMWCRRKLVKNGGCAEFETYMTDVMGQQFEALDAPAAVPIVIPEVSLITPERRSYILQHRKAVEVWLDRLEAEALEDALAGRPTPGMKAVVDTQKGTKVKYLDEEGAATLLEPVLGEQSFTKKLITPTQVRKQVSPEVWADLIEKGFVKLGEPGQSIVPEADRRKAITSAAEFDDL